MIINILIRMMLQTSVHQIDIVSLAINTIISAYNPFCRHDNPFQNGLCCAIRMTYLTTQIDFTINHVFLRHSRCITSCTHFCSCYRINLIYIYIYIYTSQSPGILAFSVSLAITKGYPNRQVQTYNSEKEYFYHPCRHFATCNYQDNVIIVRKRKPSDIFSFAQTRASSTKISKCKLNEASQ